METTKAAIPLQPSCKLQTDKSSILETTNVPASAVRSQDRVLSHRIRAIAAVMGLATIAVAMLTVKLPTIAAIPVIAAIVGTPATGTPVTNIVAVTIAATTGTIDLVIVMTVTVTTGAAVSTVEAATLLREKPLGVAAIGTSVVRAVGSTEAGKPQIPEEEVVLVRAHQKLVQAAKTETQFTLTIKSAR